MDEKEKKQEEFDLEDILKEFSVEESGEYDTEALEEDVLIWDGVIPEESSHQPWSPEDTVRLDGLTKAFRQQEKTEEASEETMEEELDDAIDQSETISFTPVGQEQEEEAYILPEEEEKVEPYSAQWEPEYEQPIGEYVPIEPIVFRPKSRLQELKKKLIEGPEKQYYALAEQGLGKLQAAIGGNLLVALLASGTTAMSAFGWIAPERTKFVIFVQFFSLLVSALLGSYQLIEGLADLKKKHFSLNSLLLFSLFACLVDSVVCLYQVRVPCCATFSLHMTMSLWSAYHKRNTEMGQMDTMRKAVRLDSVGRVEDYYEGRAGFLRGEGQVEDFMDHYQGTSDAEEILYKYGLIALLVSLGVAAVGGVFHGVAFGVQAFAAGLLIAVPATSHIFVSRPMSILERRLHRLGTVLCGWQGVMGLSANGVFPVEDEDLFPIGSAKLNGVKFYGSRTPDEVVAYAAALICAAGGGMSPLFSQLLESRNGYHYEAEGLRGYPQGIGAGVNGEAVLAGTLHFMQDMGVDMPESTHVNQAIYVAIDGQLSGVFAISYQKTKSAARGIGTLSAYRGLSPVLVGGDFMMTEEFLQGKFGIRTRQFEFPEYETRRSLQEKKMEENTPVLALTTKDGLAEAAFAVTGARALRSTATWGLVIHMLSGILGLVMLLLLAIVGAEYLLTPVNVLLYAVIWIIPSLLMTE